MKTRTQLSFADAQVTLGSLREQLLTSQGSHEDNLTKYQTLIDLEQKRYKEIVKQIIHSPLEKSILLLELLEQLAMVKLEQANLLEVHERLSLYNQAAVRYIYLKKSAEYLLSLDNTEDIKGEYLRFSSVAKRGIQVVHENILATTHDDFGTTTEIESDVDILSQKDSILAIRALAKSWLESEHATHFSSSSISEVEYINSARHLFDNMAQMVKSYLSNLISDAEAIFGPPPCKYSVIGLGSMALKSITPYSDLEFAIITESEEYKSLPAKSSYFKNLCHYVHFKVICLGETIIPTSDYGIDMSHIVAPAINFDLGGKTPLGRKDKPYDLICTIDQMLVYLRNDGGKSEHIDKALPYILQTTCYVYGNEELAELYQIRANEFLSSDDESGKKHSESRAIKALLEGTVEHSYLGDHSIKISKGNLEQLEVGAHTASTFGLTYNIKQELYRLPDRLIYNLALICSVYDGSVWDIVDTMHTRGIITKEASENLHKMITFAYVLRLRVYNFYGSQKEKMDIGDILSGLGENNPEIFHLSKEEMEEDGGLFKHYYSALSLLEKLRTYCNQKSLASQETIIIDGTTFFKEDTFFDESTEVKFLVCQRLSKYKDAVKYGEQHLAKLELLESSDLNDKEVAATLNNSENNHEVAMLYNNIGMCYSALGRHTEALTYKQKALEILHGIFGETHEDIATLYNNIGNSYEDIGKYNLACENKEKALAMRTILLGEKSADVANSYDSVGSIYSKLDRHAEALVYKEKALLLQIELFGANHQMVAIAYNNVGMIYGDLGDHYKELEYKTKCLNILLALLGEKHQDVATCYSNIATTYSELKKFDEAIFYIKKSITISEELLGEWHPDLASLHTNLGIILADLEDYATSLQVHEKALAIAQKAPDQNPSDIAAIHNNIGYTFGEMGDYEEAINSYKQALNIWLKLRGEQNADVALSYHNLGATYGEMGNHAQALKYEIDALRIWQVIFGEESPYVVKSEKNIGMIHYNLKEYGEAISHIQRAIEIQEKLGQIDLGLAGTYTTIGAICSLVTNYTEAEKYLIKALQIRITESGIINEDVAISYINLSNCCRNALEYDKALFYMNKSIAIHKELFGAEDARTIAAARNMLPLLVASGQIDSFTTDIIHDEVETEVGGALPPTSDIADD